MLLVSGFLFGLMPLFAKQIYLHGGNALGLLFLRFAIGGAVFLLIMRFTGAPCVLKKDEILSVFLVSLPEALTSVLLYQSYNYISSGTATTLHFSYPAAVLILETLIFRKKLNRRNLLCCALCILGIVMFYLPEALHGAGSSAPGSLAGLLLALSSGIVYSSYILALTHIDKVNTMPRMKLSAWVSLMIAVELACIMAFTGKFSFQMDANGWGLAVLCSAFVSSFAFLTFQAGAGRCGPQTAALLSTSEPASSVIFGILILGESMSIFAGAGCAFILLSIVLQVAVKGDPA
ncbi:MAG: DMT family transporter [Lachnospiraceae bacterium]|nr:DMT family transporter [Lachnospiraceae bacterium]